MCDLGSWQPSLDSCTRLERSVLRSSADASVIGVDAWWGTFGLLAALVATVLVPPCWCPAILVCADDEGCVGIWGAGDKGCVRITCRGLRNGPGNCV